MTETNRDLLDSFVEGAVTNFDVQVKSFKFVSASENIVYRINTVEGDSFALRIHRPGYHDLVELESEHLWTAVLSDAGFRVPHPLFTRNGSAYSFLSFDSDGSRYVGMSTWLEGAPLQELMVEKNFDQIKIFGRAGALIAQLHNHSEQWKMPEAFTRHSLDIEGLLGDSPWWTQYWKMPEMSQEQSKTILAARDRLRTVLMEQGISSQNYGVIHGDLLPQNILVHDSVLSPIDFDDCAFGYHLYDISVALINVSAEANFPEILDSFVREYRKHRDFSDQMLQTLPLFILIRQFMQIGWFNSRVSSALVFGSGKVIKRGDFLVPAIQRAVDEANRLLANL
jgi:Ser/Thr protein kinase RdoA (MazF antagonist)